MQLRSRQCGDEVGRQALFGASLSEHPEIGLHSDSNGRELILRWRRRQIDFDAKVQRGVAYLKALRRPFST
jgi:hypothetical protein